MVMTTNPRRLTQKQETFCRLYFELGNATEAALRAGYSKRTATVIASENLTKPNIEKRLSELRQKAVDESIATVQERKQILTDIARAALPDYVDENGDIKVSKESPHVSAVSEITSKTKSYRRTGEVAVITNLKLHDPTKAIDLLNKMDKIYSESPTVNIDNRKVEIVVSSEQGQNLLEKVLNGTGTAADAPDSND